MGNLEFDINLDIELEKMEKSKSILEKTEADEVQDSDIIRLFKEALKEGQVIIFRGESGTGKTLLSLYLISYVIKKHNYRCLYFSPQNNKDYIITVLKAFNYLGESEIPRVIRFIVPDIDDIYKADRLIDLIHEETVLLLDHFEIPFSENICEYNKFMLRIYNFAKEQGKIIFVNTGSGSIVPGDTVVNFRLDVLYPDYLRTFYISKLPAQHEIREYLLSVENERLEIVDLSNMKR